MNQLYENRNIDQWATVIKKAKLKYFQEVMHMSYYGMETVEILATAFGCLMASLSALVLLAEIVSAYHDITAGHCQGLLIAQPNQVFFQG